MIPLHDAPVFERCLEILSRFGTETNARGRFVALYLGLRRMGNGIAILGSDEVTSAGQIENFLDTLFLKTHIAAPLNVLTALFGGSTSPNAPWSTRTGALAPENRYPTNTWRNNFNVQKGIGCPAAADTINAILADPTRRLSCPHMAVDDEGRHACSITGTTYRGEEHSIWLRFAEGGYQVVNLNDPVTFEDYLAPRGRRIPVFPLIGALYSFAQDGTYPERPTIGIPDFARDFGFTVEQVEQLFDADPESAGNREILMLLGGQFTPLAPTQEPLPQPLPPDPEPAILNTGVGAELSVARDLQSHGWEIVYVANITSLGYDLRASKGGEILKVEVKSSVGGCTPELTNTEWLAAQENGETFVLAVVSFYGSDGQEILYVRNPAANLVPAERETVTYRFSRDEIGGLSVDATFL